MTTSVAEMVEALIAAGTPPGIAASIVTLAFAAGATSVGHVTSRDQSVTFRRESDRLRKQRSRDRLVTNCDVTGQCDAPLSKSILKEEEREAESVTSRDQWRPSEPDWIDAVTKLGEAAATSELIKFREIDRGMLAAKAPRWRVWVQRAIDYAAKNKTPPSPPPSTEKGFDWEAVVRTWLKTGYWSPQAGPDPESPACRCPREIVEKCSIGVRQ